MRLWRYGNRPNKTNGFVRMVINTNIAAVQQSRLLKESSHRLSTSIARMSSGSKIPSPQDDAGGLSQTINLDSQVTRINAAISNNTNLQSMMQTQDGYAQKAQVALLRMNELAVLYKDNTKTSEDKALYEQEFNQLEEYIWDITTKKYNGADLFFAKGQVLKDSNADVTTLTENNIADGLGGGQKTNGEDGEFKIDLVFEPNAEGNEFTAEHKIVFEEAANRIEGFITGDLTDWTVNGEVIDDVKITVKYEDAADSDGIGGSFGAVNVSQYRTDATALPVVSEIYLDEADVEDHLHPNGSLYGVVIKKMISSLGFSSTKFYSAGVASGTTYTGAKAVAKYNEATGSSVTQLPLEDDLGGITGPPWVSASHWEENETRGGVVGFQSELMTGWLGGKKNPLSAVSVGAMEDIGYEVNYDTADPWTGPVAFSDSGTGDRPSMKIDSLASVRIALKNLANSRAQINSQLAYTKNINDTLSIEKENLTAASSQIKDVDVAEESANLARQTILVNTAMAMLAQANVLPELILRLIE